MGWEQNLGLTPMRERESSTCNERKSFDINNKKVKCYLK